MLSFGVTIKVENVDIIFKWSAYESKHNSYCQYKRTKINQTLSPHRSKSLELVFGDGFQSDLTVLLCSSEKKALVSV